MKYQCSEFERVVASLFLSFFYKNNTNPDTKKTTEEAIRMYSDSFANGEMKAYPKLTGRIRAEVATEAALLDMVKELDGTCNPADMKQLKEMTKDPNRYDWLERLQGNRRYRLEELRGHQEDGANQDRHESRDARVFQMA